MERMSSQNIKYAFKSYYIQDFYLVIDSPRRSTTFCLFLIIIYYLQLMSLTVTDNIISKTNNNDKLMQGIFTIINQFKGGQLITSVLKNDDPSQLIVIFETILNGFHIILIIIGLVAYNYKRAHPQQGNLDIFLQASQTFTSTIFGIYHYVLSMPFFLINFKLCFDTNKEGIYYFLAIINIPLSLLIGLIGLLHEFTYTFKPRDILARRENFMNIFFFATEFLMCLIVQTNANLGVIAFMIIIHSHLFNFAIHLDFHSLKMCKIQCFLICITWIIWLVSILQQIDLMQNIQTSLFVISSVPFLWKLSDYYMQKRVERIILSMPQTNLQEMNENKVDNYCRILSQFSDLDTYEYLNKAKGMIFETVFTDHILRCRNEKCFCGEFLNESDIPQDSDKEIYISIKPNENIKRNKFLSLLIMDIYSGYLRRRVAHSQNEFQKLLFSYYHFLIEIMEIPTCFVEIVTTRNTFKHNHASLILLFYIEEISRLANKKFSKLFFNSDIQNQRLDMMSVIEYSDLDIQICQNLRQTLSFKREILIFLNIDYINLQQLSEMGERYLSFRDELQSQIKRMFELNPNSNRSHYFVQIFSQNFDIYRRSVETFENYKKPPETNMLKEDLDIDLFKKSSCMIYITLLNPIGLIKRVSSSFQRMFQIAPDDVIGKSCNVIIPESVANVHDEMLVKFVAKGYLNYIRRDFIFIFGKKPNGFIFPIHARFKLICEQENDFGIVGFFEEMNQKYDYFLCDPQGIICDVTQRIYSYCFENIWKQDKSKINIMYILFSLKNDLEKIEGLDICKLIPIIGYQIHKQNLKAINQVNMTIMCVPRSSQMMNHFHKKHTQQSVLPLDQLIWIYKNHNEFVFLEVNYTFEQYDTPIGFSQKFVEILSFSRLKKLNEIQQGISLIRLQIQQILQTSPQSQDYIEEQSLDEAKQRIYLNSQSTALEQFSIIGSAKNQVSSSRKQINSFENKKHSSLFKVIEEQQIQPFKDTILEEEQLISVNSTFLTEFGIINQDLNHTFQDLNLRSSSNNELNFRPRHINGLARQTDRLFQQGQKETTPNQILHQNDDFTKHMEFAISTDRPLLSNDQKDHNKEDAKNSPQNNIHYEIRISSPDIDLSQISNTNTKQRIDPKSQVTNLEFEDLTNYGKVQNNGTFNLNQSRLQGRSLNTSWLLNQVSINQGVDMKLQTLIEGQALSDQIQNVSGYQAKKSNLVKIFEQAEETQVSNRTTRLHRLNNDTFLMTNSSDLSDKNISEKGTPSIMKRKLNKIEATAKQVDLEKKPSEGSVNSDQRQMKSAIITQILKVEAPKFANKLIRIGQLSGLIIILMSIVQFGLTLQQAIQLHTNQMSQEGLPVFVNDFLKIIMNVEIVRYLEARVPVIEREGFDTDYLLDLSTKHLGELMGGHQGYIDELEDTSGISYFNSMKLNMNEFNNGKPSWKDVSFIYGFHQFFYYGLEYITNKEDNPFIQAPVNANYIEYVTDLKSFFSVTHEDLIESLNKNQDSLLIVFISIIIITFLSVFLIVPIKISIEAEKEEILRLMCTFSPQKLQEYIKDVEKAIHKLGELQDSVVSKNSYSNKNMNVKLQTLRFFDSKPTNYKSDGTPNNRNSYEEQKKQKLKRKTISHTSNLPRIQVPTIFYALLILLLLSLQPALVYTLDKVYQKSFIDSLYTLFLIGNTGIHVSENFSSFFMTVNFKRMFNSQNNSLFLQCYPDNFYSDLLSHLKEVININKDIRENLKHLHQRIEDSTSLSPLNKASFLTVVDSNLCNEIPLYLNNLKGSLDETYPGLIVCKPEKYKDLLASGLILSLYEIMQIFENALPFFELNTIQEFEDRLFAYNKQVSFPQMQETFDNLDASVNVITSIISTDIKDNSTYLQNINIELFLVQILAIFLVYSLLWQTLLLDIRKTFFRVKSFISFFSIGQILENQYLSNYLNKNLKFSRYK